MELFPQFYVYNKETGQVHATNDIQAAEKQFIDQESRQVGLDTVGDTVVSTVFIGIPYAEGMLFETVVYPYHANGEKYWEKFVSRYQTAGDAKRGHKKVVKMIKKEQERNKNDCVL